MPTDVTDSSTRIVVGPHDAVPDVLNRLRAGRSASATIAIPSTSSLFLTASEFRALKATAEQAKRILTIETDDRLRKQLAEMFGLPVVDLAHAERPAPEKTTAIVFEPGRGVLESGDDSTEAPRAATKPRRSLTKPRRSFAKPRGLAIAAAALVVLLAAGLIAAYLLQTASIAITTKRTAVSADVTFAVAKQGVASPSGSSFTVQANPATFDVPFTATIPATGRARTPDATATGKVQLRNPSSKPVAIAAGTTFVSFDGVEYFFPKDVTVPAADAKSKTPGKAEADVSASAGGTNGNKDAGMLSGKLDSGVYYSNRDAILSGGADTSPLGVAQQDVDTLIAQAKQQLPELAKTVNLGNGMAVLPGSVQAGDLTYAFDHKVGEQAGTLTVNAKMRVTALAYSTADVQAQASAALQDSLAAQVPSGYELVANSMTFDAPVQLNDQGSTAQFKLTAHAPARATIAPQRAAEIEQAVAGTSIDDARAYLGSLPEVQSVEISSSPGFLPARIPGNADRVTITAK